jgi:hypothetical protein
VSTSNSEWYEEDLKKRELLTWKWSRLRWPSGLNTMSEGEYRIVEGEAYDELFFQPQFRQSEAHAWESWLRWPPGRMRGCEAVSFPTLRKAQRWLDEAHANRPHIGVHNYNPNKGAA